MKPVPSAWAVATCISIACGVAFSVLLMSVSQGVADQLQGDVNVARLPNVSRIDNVLTLLTVVVTSAMLLQTAIATFVMGLITMRGRRAERSEERRVGEE